jgi:hypothetical protein
VHPTKHIYEKAALNLIEMLAVSNKPAAAAVTTNRKRTVSVSNMSGQAGGSRADGEREGGPDRSPSGPGNSDRSTSRSRQWPALKSRGTTAAAAAEDLSAAEKGTGTTRMIRGRAAVPEGHPIVVPTADPDPDTGEGAVGSGEAATPIKWSLGDRVIPNYFSVK